jgi:hypothetical protein
MLTMTEDERTVYYTLWDMLDADQKNTTEADQAQGLFGVNPESTMRAIALLTSLVKKTHQVPAQRPCVVIDLSRLDPDDEQADADRVRDVADLIEDGNTSGYHPDWVLWERREPSFGEG